MAVGKDKKNRYGIKLNLQGREHEIEKEDRRKDSDIYRKTESLEEIPR